jgi:hypothetical protein
MALLTSSLADVRAFVLATSPSQRTLMLRTGVLSGVELPVTSKHTTSAAWCESSAFSLITPPNFGREGGVSQVPDSVRSIARSSASIPPRSRLGQCHNHTYWQNHQLYRENLCSDLGDQVGKVNLVNLAEVLVKGDRVKISRRPAATDPCKISHSLPGRTLTNFLQS